ncbi:MULTISPECIES: 2-amino-3,7-dideoxy-D-threo-hept-6-ulosonate synthase [Mycobacteriaceae]|uniref:2-amino-3,7-dideoxy-D-threo-hept-6-ulosonate synthase n=1 Tax=Mycobacteriaceae TaxID=1762 RepID=UPI0008000A55|nr:MULTISPECIES: 2-amino-3,7-dideoxy-D-threo-hept-6-ulosonate synthase [Mycobacteriaceae]MCK0175259.1 2-amino-3,7-dideoxy-D-threo-hept-6-ulosonate synthase [Mycolicibacterium sp. F2034L]OBB59783.1 transaldolase [Mycobacterium sp. 852013-51886_SCH5428379]
MFDLRSRHHRANTGTRIRLSRIFHPESGRALVVPMDHSVTIGPLGGGDHADRTAGLLAAAGADAVVVHKGRARTIDPGRFADMALIVHLSAGTDLSLDRTSKVLVGSVEECLRLGADAVSVHVNVGSPTEARQLTDLGAVASECETLGVPLLAMMYARGPEMGSRTEIVETLCHLAAIATDLGADMVKLDYAGSVAGMNRVVDTCPLPILVAGGPTVSSDDEAIAFGSEVAESRVAGLSFGRLIFDADNPRRVAAELTGRLHAPQALTTAPLTAALESA